jgi:hypothetical protein
MSKKLYSTIEWKRRSKRRQEDELKKLRRHKRAKRIGRHERIRKRTSQTRSFVPLQAPRVFSLLKDPESVIEFLRKIKSVGGRNHLAFDFSGITLMTVDAVAAFIATIRAMPATQVKGNLPKEPAVAEMLTQSGFFDHLRSRKRVPTSTKGRIAQKQSTRVEPKIAQDLIHVGTQAIFGASKRQQATYRVLIESMTNTMNHAADYAEGKQTWWATVYADLESKRVCYTILDMGVGVFRSLKVRGLRKFYLALGMRNNSDILKDILQGKVESSTGIKYRGKGLPAIYRDALSKRIQSLVIITNNVYANIETGEFRLLPKAFNGMLLYWENE